MKNKLVLSALLALAILLAACGPQSTVASTPTAASVPTEAPYTKGDTATTAAAAPATVEVAPTDNSGYGYGYGDNTISATETPASQSSSDGGVTVMTAQSSKLGAYLVNSQGMSLYMLTSDTATASTCTGGCPNNWPALTVTGAPTAGDGVDGSLLGTLPRADGTTQVTYNGHPLYTYKKDIKPGDTNGQGVGGSWFALTPKGSQIQ